MFGLCWVRCGVVQNVHCRCVRKLTKWLATGDFVQIMFNYCYVIFFKKSTILSPHWRSKPTSALQDSVFCLHLKMLSPDIARLAMCQVSTTFHSLLFFLCWLSSTDCNAMYRKHCTQWIQRPARAKWCKMQYLLSQYIMCCNVNFGLAHIELRPELLKVTQPAIQWCL